LQSGACSFAGPFLLSPLRNSMAHVSAVEQLETGLLPGRKCEKATGITSKSQPMVLT